MPINLASIASSLPTLPSLGGASSSGTAKPAGADFGSALKQAIGSLQQLGQQADSSSLALAQGQPVDVHEVMLNTEQASLGFSMALQVRNKLIDAYSEIMRMSV
jgi:flagellar hook-basal body complex protein FliE